MRETQDGIERRGAAAAWPRPEELAYRLHQQSVLAEFGPDWMPVQKYDIRRPDGRFEVRWWAPLNTPVFGPEGEVRHIIHQVEDVTGEMLEREQAAEARAGEARFRAVAEAIPGLVFETDSEGRNTYLNGQYSDYTGSSEDELLTNAYQYAYPEGQAGVVEVLGARQADGRYRLEVADHGRGLPPGFALAKDCLATASHRGRDARRRFR